MCVTDHQLQPEYVQLLIDKTNPTLHVSSHLSLSSFPLTDASGEISIVL